MTGIPKKYEWEDWQLTAYLLGELEPDLAAQIADAAKSDAQLAGQLDELAKTLQDVQALYSREGKTVGDQAALAALQANVSGDQSAGLVRPATQGITVRRLASRWENWASLAGLILIGVLLFQRSGRETVVAINETAPAHSGPRSDASSINQEAARSVVLEESVDEMREQLRQEAGGRSSSSAASQPHPQPKTISRTPAIGMGTPMQGPNMGGPAGSSPQPTPDATTGPTPGPTPGPMVQLAQGGAMGGMGSGDMGIGAGYGAEGGDALGGGMGSMGGYGAPADGVRSRFKGFESEVSEMGFAPVPRDHQGGDRFAAYSDNEFEKVGDQPLSTFSIDVDTAAYTKARQYLLEHRQLPPPASVRIEEFINYFDYEYAGPKDDKPFGASLAVTQCPWEPKHQLVRIALQAKQVETADRPRANLVFLLDVSGSMDAPNKLPLVKETIRLLTYQLNENDKVAIVVYAGAAGCVLESTHGHQQDKILSAIERLSAGGSTNGGQGIQLAYKLARENFVPGGINRVLLCTDGDFNVGVTSTDDLVELVKEQAQSNVFLTVLGYGIGNTNDAMMEQIADRGNGLYGFVDSRREAQRQMVKQLAGNLMTVAKDVKVQVEFNPGKVRAYRLIGYENRRLATEDFNNDKKDAGEIGAGHRVTALYELVPVHVASAEPLIDGLRYQAEKRREAVEPVKLEDGAVSNELLAVKLRYKQPEGSESQLLTFPLDDKSVPYAEIDKDFRWAAAMAEFGMLLRRSPHKGQASWSSVTERARAALGNPVDIQRAEALEMIGTASNLR